MFSSSKNHPLIEEKAIFQTCKEVAKRKLWSWVPTGLEPQNYCAGEDQEQFTQWTASWSQASPANLSICSKKFITEFLENDLDACLSDEPQDNYFKLPEMYPEVVYVCQRLSNDYYGPMKLCELGTNKK